MSTGIIWLRIGRSGSCEHSNKPSGSIKLGKGGVCVEFPDGLRDYYMEKYYMYNSLAKLKNGQN
jgi:hypothetical protein